MVCCWASEFSHVLGTFAPSTTRISLCCYPNRCVCIPRIMARGRKLLEAIWCRLEAIDRRAPLFFSRSSAAFNSSAFSYPCQKDAHHWERSTGRPPHLWLGCRTPGQQPTSQHRSLHQYKVRSRLQKKRAFNFAVSMLGSLVPLLNMKI